MTPDETAAACAEAMWAGDTASRSLGIEIAEVAEGRSRLTMTVTAAMVNGWGMAHGGYVSLLADSAFACACNTHDEVTVASGFDVTFLAPAHQGDVLTATALERTRVGRSGLCDVTVTRSTQDGVDAVVAEFRGRSRGLGRPILEPGT